MVTLLRPDHPEENAHHKSPDKAKQTRVSCTVPDSSLFKFTVLIFPRSKTFNFMKQIFSISLFWYEATCAQLNLSCVI